MIFKNLSLLLGFVTAGISSFSQLEATNSEASTTGTARYCEHSYLICTVTDQGSTMYGTWNEDGPTTPEVE